MNSLFKTIWILALYLANSLQINGQISLTESNPWTLGLLTGASYHYSDIHSEGVSFASSLIHSKFAYGVFIERNVNDRLSLRTSYLKSEITGSSDLEKSSIISFNSPIQDFSFQIKSILSKNKISPFITIGAGFQLTKAEVLWKDEDNGHVRTDINQIQNSHFVIPFSLGVQYEINKRFKLSTELSGRKIFSDYIDGISYTSDPDNTDWNGFLTFNMSIRLGKFSDLDKDGIADFKDECPAIPGNKLFNGCPDTDNDGVKDYEDLCPLVPGMKLHSGCPDSDADGIIDKNDKCPDDYGEKQGCPDSDKDGIIDIEDNCPKEIGLIKNAGCPDFDLDGVIDKNDLCPKTFGKKQNNGCPEIDSDDDSIPDHEDKCPLEAGPISNEGCPDLIEPKIKIPDTLKIFFSDNSHSLEELDIKSIQEILEYILEHKNAILHLKGYADFRGAESYNLNLSKLRVETVSKWFQENGILQEQIISEAIGEIGTENTQELDKFRFVEIFIQQ